MTPDQWRRVKDLLAAAIELDTAGQRELVEREFRQDPLLRAEVQELLTNFTLATLRLPPAFAAAGDAAVTSPPSQPEGLRLERGDMCGRYEVVRMLGAGGMARVYLATDTELSTPVALKVLSDELLESSEARLRLRREAHNAAKLRGHPHIATFLDLIHVDVKDRQFPVIVMEYVEGTSCAEHLTDHPIGIHRALRWTSQIADAVEYAHDRGVLHCDLKPQNIQVTPDDMVKVLDFGVARAMYGPSTADIATGTLPYMAPEQIAEKRFTEAGDIYSLGVTMFELITRQRPFTGDSTRDVMFQILGLPAPHASALAADVPADLDSLIERTLAKAPRHRPQSMRELRLELAGVLSALEPAGATPARRLANATAIVGTVLAILTFVGFVSSMAFDLSLGRRGPFADESALLWPIWGARMLVTPLVQSALFLVPAILAVSLLRWGARRMRVGRARLSPLERLRTASTRQLATLVLLASILAVNAFFFRFQNGVAATANLVADSVSTDIGWMRPENFDEHNAYRFVAFLVCAGSSLAWLWLARRRRALLQPPTVLLPILGALVLAVALGLWALPYRLLFQAEFERVHLGNETCYVAARQEPELLLFCPKSAPPRARVVSARDPMLQRDRIIEKVFTVFNTADSR
jgi:hypothetical protein